MRRWKWSVDVEGAGLEDQGGGARAQGRVSCIFKSFPLVGFQARSVLPIPMISSDALCIHYSLQLYALQSTVVCITA